VNSSSTHPAIGLLPVRDSENLVALVADIKKHGLKQPVSAGRDVLIGCGDCREQLVTVPLNFAADIPAASERGKARQL
jgi:hypothetical protein